MLSSIIGLIGFLVVAQWVTSPGESFMFDWLLWFVRIMVGGSLSFNWLAEPETFIRLLGSHHFGAAGRKCGTGRFFLLSYGGRRGAFCPVL